MFSVCKTVKARILSHNANTFNETLYIYRDALKFYIDVINQNWHLIKDLNKNERLKLTEQLTHPTRNNPKPKYPFDLKGSVYYKFPSYLRRACIMDATGVISSHKSRHENWLKKRDNALSEGNKFHEKKPKLQYYHKNFPVFYKSNMFQKLDDNQAQIKIYKGNNNWEWINIEFDDKNFNKRDLGRRNI